jgi:hypothetical protein
MVDFETTYHGILGRPSLAKFMAIPHYTYMVLKMLTPNDVITSRGTQTQLKLVRRTSTSQLRSISPDAPRRSWSPLAS